MASWRAAIFLVAVLAPFALASEYVRPPPVESMPLEHPRLVRQRSDPHAPEQLHISLAGPGAVEIAWVTSPPNLAAAAAQPPRLVQRVGKAFRSAASALGLPLQRISTAFGSALSVTGVDLQHSDARTAGCKTAMLQSGIRSIVQFGPQPGEYIANVSSHEPRCYTTTGYQSGALHHVIVGNGGEGPLDALATYFYRVGDPLLGWSEEFNFTMPRETHQNGGFPYRLGLIGDLGQTENSAQTLEHLTANKPDSILNVGDLSYADGEQQRWDSFGRLVQPLTATVPHMSIEGNHEFESIDGAPKDFLAWTSRWPVPFERSGSDSPLYYSYETGPAHIIMLGSYAPYGKHSAQVAWLRKDLETVDRARTPWLIVGMHAPWYNSNEVHHDEVEDMRQVMEPLLYSYGVDLVFTGHVHAYERSHRVFNNERDECGARHIVIGDGGNREGLAANYMKKPVWSANREASYGHATLDFEDATSAVFRWHRNQDGIPVTADELRVQRRPECVGQVSAAAGSAKPDSDAAAVAAQRRRQRRMLGSV